MIGSLKHCAQNQRDSVSTASHIGISRRGSIPAASHTRISTPTARQKTASLLSLPRICLVFLLLALLSFALIPSASFAYADQVQGEAQDEESTLQLASQEASAQDTSEAITGIAVELKDSSDWTTYLSDPIIVNNQVYIAVGDELRILDAETGELVLTASLAASIDSVARMVYTDGLVIVPLNGGRLQAFAADTLSTVWLSEELEAIGDTGVQQSLTSLYVKDGYVYYGTAAATWESTLSGYFVCVSLDDGSVQWSKANESTGYYWTGATSVYDWIVIADDAGILHVFNTQGDETSSLSLGSAVRSAVVAGSEEGIVFVVSNDGVIHKIQIDEQSGGAEELASLSFASSSTSTPTVADGKIYVGGVALSDTSDLSYGGVLAVIDEDALTLDYQITSLDDSSYLPGDVKATPLVFQQGSETYVYFTCNAQPGAVYSYHLGDATAASIYTPDEAYQNYCMASVVCGDSGTLYYVNDSGALFVLTGVSDLATVSTDEQGSAFSWWTLAGLIIGVCGLIAVCLGCLAAARRKKQKED